MKPKTQFMWMSPSLINEKVSRLLIRKQIRKQKKKILNRFEFSKNVISKISGQRTQGVQGC